MPIEVVMPKFGLTMQEGTIQQWFKAEGDTIQRGEALFEVETEKVLYEVEAPADGVVAKLLYPAESSVPCARPVAVIALAGEDPAQVAARSAATPAAATAVGLGDLAAHYFGDPGNLDRRDLQAKAQRFMSDDNCLACHQDLYKDTKDQPISEIGRFCHDAYLGKNGATKHGCAGCHSNLAHLPEFDRRYEVNAKFAAKLAQEKETK